MKRLLYLAACALMVMTACQKDLLSPINDGSNQRTDFSVLANLNAFENDSDMSSADIDSDAATKAVANAVVRLNWSAGDKISAINLTTGMALGGDLVAQSSGSSSLFSGTLVGTINRGDQIAFLYPSQGYTKEVNFTGAVIDLSGQEGSSAVPLVVSGTATMNASSVQNISIEFGYLMSYYLLNLSELPESTPLANVRFYGMGAKATLSINGAKNGFVSSPVDDVIKVESATLASNSKGAKAVYIAGFASPSKSSAREVRVRTSDNSYKTTWTASALSTGKFYTSIINKFEEFDEPADYIDEYGVNRGAGIPIIEDVDGESKTVVWAPVNLGYSDSYPYGKLYQWGRKVGQGYGPANGNDEAGNRITVEATPAESGTPFMAPEDETFYTKSDFPYDWYAATTGEQFKMDWNDIPSDDYVGNPCPDGWRVPTGQEFEGLNASRSSWTVKNGQNGYFFRGSSPSLPDASSIFLPAPGFRSNIDGYSGSRGNVGHYWSSTPDTRNALYVDLSRSDVYVGSNGRANAFSVRCVQEDGSNAGSGVNPDKWNSYQTVLIPEHSSIAGTQSAFVDASFDAVDGAATVKWTTDAIGSTLPVFDVRFLAEDNSVLASTGNLSSLRSLFGNASSAARIKRICTVKNSSLAWYQYEDGKAYNGTLSFEDASGRVVAVMAVSMTKELPTAAPAGYSPKTGSVLNGVYNCYLTPNDWAAGSATSGSIQLAQAFDFPQSVSGGSLASNFEFSFAASAMNSQYQTFDVETAGSGTIRIDRMLIDGQTAHNTTVRYNYGGISSAGIFQGFLLDYKIDVDRFYTVYNSIYNYSYSWDWVADDDAALRAALGAPYTAKTSTGAYAAPLPDYSRITYNTSVSIVGGNLAAFIKGTSSYDTGYNAYLNSPYRASLSIQSATLTSNSTRAQDYMQPVVASGMITGFRSVSSSANPASDIPSTLTVVANDMYGNRVDISLPVTVKTRD